MGLLGMFSQKDTVENIQEYLTRGAVVIDVRTIAEWNESHIEGSKHIVLNTIPENLELIKGLHKPIIAVCKSGGRSQSATDFLSQNGLDVINGGPWQQVAQFMDQ
jgi:phage shock protein E